MKEEIDKVKNEIMDIYTEKENTKNEIEELRREYDSMQAGMDISNDESELRFAEIDKLREEETNAYFDEKRIQDELLFVLKEKEMFKNEVDKLTNGLGFSDDKLGHIKREFMFTKGECNYILEKIDYLMAKLDSTLKMKGVSQDKLSSFIDQLKCVHETLVEAYKNTSTEYYANKQ